MSTEPERRLVAVLVTDIVDSTPIAERLGAERYKTLFDEIARLMREQVERFGGTVAQHTGDGILALFGAPTAHEDDSERAVRAALAIHEALEPFAAGVAGAYGVDIAARAAVNTGPALLLRGDEPADRLYNALGDTVTVAARLQGHAGTRGTIVGSLTARQVERLYELEPLGQLDLKGRDEPVAASLVLGELMAVRGGDLTPLVGRVEELGVLAAGLDELGEGRGMVAVIRGEPGIGKSRLVLEARESVVDSVRFLEGTAVAYAETFPYWSIRNLLRDWLEVGAGAPDALVRLELKTALAALLPDAAGTYPFVATVVGAPLDAGETRALSGLTADSVQRQTVEAIRDIVVALSRERPLCLVVDDLHWADESTLGLLDELLDVTDEEAVGLILLARSEREHGSWRLGEAARQRLPHRLTEIELKPLGSTSSRLLLVEAAGASVPADVEAVLADRAGGNPFFLEEALRDLVAQGTLFLQDGAYVLAVEIDDLTVPLLVQEALQARLDRLPTRARELVGVASVIGRSFASPLLEELVPGERLHQLLGELERLDFITQERRRPVSEYRFRHGLVQEVAYASLTHERRRELHRRTAVALESLHGNAVDEIAGLLAYHLAEGNEPAAAAHWFERAGDTARAQYANDEAASLYDRAVTLYDSVGDGVTARHVLLKIAIGHVTAFRFAEGNAAYGSAFARPLPTRTIATEPSERLSVPMFPSDSIVPGYSYSVYGEFVARQLFRGLVDVDREMTIVPQAAESFEISADGASYRFRLRSDIFWHDGVKVTAGDFAWAWEQIRDLRTEPSFLLEGIAAVDATDDLTLEVRLFEPSNMFLYLMARAVAFAWPRHRGEVLRADTVDLVGNGPFSLVRADENAFRLEAFDGWPHPRGNVRHLEISVRAPEDDLPEIWRSGRFDVSFSDVGPDARTPGDSFELVARVNVMYLAFRASEPPFDDARVRRAIGFGLDRQRLADVVSPHQVYLPATRSGLIPPALPAHVHDIGVTYDLERARSLLTEAGISGARGAPEVLGLGFDAGPLWSMWMHEVCRQFEELGFRVRPEICSPDDYDAVIQERGNWFIYAWTPDVPDPSSVFEPLFAIYPAIYRDPELIELLKQARATRDRDERLRLYGDVDRAVVCDRAAILPLGYPLTHVARRGWVSGVWQNGYDSSAMDEAVVDAELRRSMTATPG